MSTIQGVFDEISESLVEVFKHLSSMRSDALQARVQMNKGFTVFDRRMDALAAQNLELSNLLLEMTKAHNVLKAEVTEMKRQYNHHLHRGSLTQIFNADRMN